MAARLQPLQEPEELQDLQIRVVRLSELGAKVARPATGDAPETALVRARPAPHPPQPSPQLPRPSPQPPPAAAKRTAAPAVAPREQPEAQRRRLLSSGRGVFGLVCVLLFLGWSTQTE